MTTFLEPAAVTGRRIELAPPLPAVVYVVHQISGTSTIHATAVCPHVRSACIETLRTARRHQRDWCTACWPGLRCTACHEPSGTRNECGACSIAQVDFEKRRDAVDGWDAA